MHDGWIRLYRKLQECWVWEDKEPFDKRSAWIDLLLTANHADAKLLFNGELITVQRGQILTSARKLSTKWKWSVNKVYRFLKLLENDKMLQKESDKDRTLLTLVNYSVYQGGEYTNEYTNGNSDGHTDGNTNGYRSETPTDTPSEHKQECNNDKNVNNNIIVSKDTICQTEAVRRVAEEWNKLEKFGIAPVRKIANGSLRYKMLVARIKEYSIDDAIRAIGNIKNSKFLLGRSDSRRQWIVTFDWFVRPNNFIKVLEGQYNDVKSGTTPSAKSTTDKQLEELANRQKQDEVIMSDEEINRMLGE